jgi:hypothetical protein
MSVTGKVVNGSVVLPPGTKLPEGATVKVETISPDDSFVATVERLAKPRPHLPRDYALNHGHYLCCGFNGSLSKDLQPLS